MPKLIDTNAQEIANDWLVLDKDCELQTALDSAAGQLVLPLTLWQSGREQLAAAGKQLAVWLDSDETAADIADDLDSLPLVALNFPKFVDGRAYSTAVNLRRHHQYNGEIRAIGDVLRDQLFYMRRCGFTTFLLADGVKLEDAEKAMQDFADNYQATIEQPEPLFRRRA